MYAATQNVMNRLSLGLPVLLLIQFFGVGVAGAYAFGVRILGAPMGLVTTALRQVSSKGLVKPIMMVAVSSGCTSRSLQASLAWPFCPPSF